MNSWFPLIEGFVAFALTMVALTSVVSALLGIWQRLFRWRSRGLRALVLYLYQREIAGLAELPKPEVRSPRKIERNARELLRERGLRDLLRFLFAELADEHGEPVDAESQFVDDMTRLPSIGGPKIDVARIDKDFTKTVESLSDADFLERLRASAVGKVIRESDPAGAEVRFAQLLARFNAYGRAATEEFTRRSRVGTVIIGFGLAFAANIDSFQLLNRYLTDPGLTARVLDRTDAILGGEVRKGDPGTATQSLQQVSTDLGTRLETIAKGLPPDQAKQLLEVKAQAAGLIEQTRQDANEALSLITGVTEAFPVGWSLYPNCQPSSVSVRCRQVRVGVRAAEWQSNNGMFATICVVAERDTPGFVRWLVGVLITGAMLGLGTPFWVEVVNNFLRARQLIQAVSTPAKTEPATGAAPADTPSATPAASPPARAGVRQLV